MSETSDEPHYLVIGPIGTPEGPYPVEVIRERLRTGRLTMEDRYLDADTQAAVDLLTIVPDAADLIQEARRRTSDRIRRRSSDRHAAVAEAAATAASSSSSRQRAAKANASGRMPAAEIASSAREAAVTAEPAPAPPVAEPAATSTGRSFSGRSLLLAVVVAVVLSVGIGSFGGVMDEGPDLTPTVQYLGNGKWTLDVTASTALATEAETPEAKARHQQFLAKLPREIGGLTVDLHPGDADIRTRNESSFHHWEALTGNGRTLGLKLLPAHPLLGERLTIRDDGDNRVVLLEDHGVSIVLRPRNP